MKRKALTPAPGSRWGLPTRTGHESWIVVKVVKGVMHVKRESGGIIEWFDPEPFYKVFTPHGGAQ